MSNPTTPFNWQMPTNTDLVTDLPADFEVFGQAVASSMADLLGGTTGQILSKATNADMDFTWIANDQGDITGITATSPLTGGGTSGAITVGIQSASTTQSGAVQLSDSTSTTSSVLAATPTAVKAAKDAADAAQTTATAAIPKSTVTTAGDVIYATGSGAVTRLGIGTTGQVLTVASGIPSWAAAASGGGMTLINTGGTTLTGTSTAVNSIPGTYNDLEIWIVGANVNTDTEIGLTINNDTTTNNYRGISAWNNGGTAYNVAEIKPYIPMQATGQSYFIKNSTANMTVFRIANYTRTDKKNVQMSLIAQSSTDHLMKQSVYIAYNTAAVTSIEMKNITTGNFQGGTMYVYGVK
jgi:hypothetical protein